MMSSTILRDPNHTACTINHRAGHLDEIFRFEKTALASTAKRFLIEELWKAVGLTVSTKSASSYISYGLPEENVTEKEGISTCWTSFHGVKETIGGWSTIRISTISDTGWGLTGLIRADPEDSDSAWIMGVDGGAELEPWCGRFNLVYEAGWGNVDRMKRDFMLLRLKGELDSSD